MCSAHRKTFYNSVAFNSEIENTLNSCRVYLYFKSYLKNVLWTFLKTKEFLIKIHIQIVLNILKTLKETTWYNIPTQIEAFRNDGAVSGKGNMGDVSCR